MSDIKGGNERYKGGGTSDITGGTTPFCSLTYNRITTRFVSREISFIRQTNFVSTKPLDAAHTLYFSRFLNYLRLCMKIFLMEFLNRTLFIKHCLVATRVWMGMSVFYIFLNSDININWPRLISISPFTRKKNRCQLEHVHCLKITFIVI